METITKITKEKGQFYLIWLTSGEKLRVSENIMVQYRLLKGQELSTEIIAEIKQAGSYDVGLQQALNYLSYQLRTEKEIRDYLRGKEIGARDRDKIVLYLESINLLNDAFYSESYVRTIMNTSDKGPKQIRQQLKQKGLSEESIDHGLSFYKEENQLDVAVKAAEKAMKRYKDKSFKDRIQKTKLHLMQKGFSQEIIELSFEALGAEKDDEQELDILQVQGEKLWQKNHRLKKGKRLMKVKQSLYQKGFAYDLIAQFITEKEAEDDTE